MADNVALLEPRVIRPNDENPRLIFRKEELESLEKSIASQGILVPLTVFRDGKQHFLLDGERRWRCALKLGLPKVPVIVQPKPDRMQNIMMMFAIHNARRDWDPLPTAMKLEELEKEFEKRNRRSPTEAELSGIASLPRGEIRRLKKLLRLPASYRKELLRELEKPRSEQVLTVDHVIETTNSAEALKSRGLLDKDEVDQFRRALLDKFRSKVVNNTVAPRKLVRLSRAYERGDISKGDATSVVRRLITDDRYSIDEAFSDAVEQADFEHGTKQIADRLLARLRDIKGKRRKPSAALSVALRELRELIDTLV